MYVVPEKLKSEKMTQTERAEIIKSIQEYRSTDDVIAYLFAEVKAVEITADDERLHLAFFELKNKHRKLLEGLDFTCGDIFPYSHELQKSIFNLQSSGLMEATNPVYEVYRIPKESKDALIKLLSKTFSSSEKTELKQMGKEFEEFLHKS